MNLEHGGNLCAAAGRFNIPPQHWIDLSTGISPRSWPVPVVPPAVWQTLPQADERLERAAAAYYHCGRESLLAVPGSQYALQYAPALLPRGRVAMPARGYAEHRLAWRSAGHHIVEYCDSAALAALVNEAAVEHAVIINPNNPTGELLQRPLLERLHRQLQGNGGWLVVDEAFVDASPQQSLAPLCPSPGLIVYRSLGKFFGLAGIRLGFLLAPPALCSQLASRMPPWSLSHPARWIGERALADSAWQATQRSYLESAAVRWRSALQHRLPDLAFVVTALFATGSGSAAYCRALNLALAQRAVLVRLFDDGIGDSLLRFGLPAPAERERALHLIQEAAEECACAMG
jgi:cobalamin biosynthesis protein CobC